MELGFSLHAATTASGNDPRAKEALVRYMLRPPLAQKRLTLLSDELALLDGIHAKREEIGKYLASAEPSTRIRRASAEPRSR